MGVNYINRNCIICGCSDKVIIPAKTKELYKARCLQCGFVFANPVPSKADYYNWYKKDVFWEQAQKELGHPTIKERIDHDYHIAIERLKKIKSVLNTDINELSKYSILDIGCGNGAFLKCAKDMGFSACGVEYDLDTVNIAYEVSNCTIYRGLIEDIYPQLGTFDIVTAHDVIEHTYDPWEFLRAATYLVGENGLLVLEYPTRESVEAKVEGYSWRHYLYREHLFLFSLEDIRYMLGKFGFVIKALDRPIPAKDTIYSIRQEDSNENIVCYPSLPILK